MSERSPYKSFDISPAVRGAMPKRRRDMQRNSGLFSGSPKSIKTKHRWANMGGEAGARQTIPCKYCRQPKFAVDGLPCPGKKK